MGTLLIIGLVVVVLLLIVLLAPRQSQKEQVRRPHFNLETTTERRINNDRLPVLRNRETLYQPHAQFHGTVWEKNKWEIHLRVSEQRGKWTIDSAYITPGWRYPQSNSIELVPDLRYRQSIQRSRFLDSKTPSYDWKEPDRRSYHFQFKEHRFLSEQYPLSRASTSKFKKNG